MECEAYVKQRSATDCITACIASITGIPYESCPQLWRLTGLEWLKALRRWSEKESLGLVYMDMENKDEWPILDGVHAIACGGNTRSSEFDHAVIVTTRWVPEQNRTELIEIFDPAGKDFLTSVKYLVFFTRRPSEPRSHANRPPDAR